MEAEVKIEQRPEPGLIGEGSWLTALWREAGTAVRPEEALIPVGLHPVAAGGSQGQGVLSPKLRERAERIVRSARAEGLPIFPVAIAPLFAGWRLHTRGRHYDYVFCNLAEDPLFHDPDGFPIPRHTLRYLERLSRSALAEQFDLLYVVHEVEKGSVREGEALDSDKLVPPSPRVQRASRHLGTLGTGLWLGATLPLVAGGGLGMAVATAAATAVLAMISPGVDPLLLGAVVAPGRPVRAGELAVWFYLAHWCYPVLPSSEEGQEVRDKG